MALMICPECGKEISDLSDKCIHCGYPIKKMEKFTPTIEFYQLVIETTGVNEKGVIELMQKIADITTSQGSYYLSKLPYVFLTGLTYEQYVVYAKHFADAGAMVSCQKDDAFKPNKSFEFSSLKNKIFFESWNCPTCGKELGPTTMICPNCGRKFIEEEKHGLGFWGTVLAVVIAIFCAVILLALC